MPSLSDWKVPASAQPKPEDYGYDLERAFNTVVGLRAIIPAVARRGDARHRTRRQWRLIRGNGLAIRGNGCVLCSTHRIAGLLRVSLRLTEVTSHRTLSSETVRL